MEKTRKEVLNKEREKCIEEIAMTDINIGILKEVDPNMIVGKKKLSEKSHEDILASVALKKEENKMAGLVRRLGVIERLLR